MFYDSPHSGLHMVPTVPKSVHMQKFRAQSMRFHARAAAANSKKIKVTDWSVRDFNSFAFQCILDIGLRLILKRNVVLGPPEYVTRQYVTRYICPW